MTLRNERVRKELMRDISEILQKEIRGLSGVVSVVDVEVSHDNSYAKVIYSVLGSSEQIDKTKEEMPFESFFKLNNVAYYKAEFVNEKDSNGEIEFIPKDLDKKEIVVATVLSMLIFW